MRHLPERPKKKNSHENRSLILKAQGIELVPEKKENV
ncbi:MAG: hypothetical protein ACI9RU_001124 [Litorivivens sp.]